MTSTVTSVDEGFLYGGVGGLPESASEGDLLADIGYEVSSDQLEVEDGGLYLYDSRAGFDSPYEVPRSAPAYLSGPMTDAARPPWQLFTGTGSAEGSASSLRQTPRPPMPADGGSVRTLQPSTRPRPRRRRLANVHSLAHVSPDHPGRRRPQPDGYHFANCR